MLTNYPGAKTHSGIIQWMINRIPAHEVYMELFAGSAQLFRALRRPRLATHLNDLNPAVIGALKKEFPESWTLKPSLNYTCESAIEFLKRPRSYGRRTFIYLDPPYPFSARRSGAKIYKFEMTADDHVQLLTAVQALDANIMISTRQNRLYDQMLRDWYRVEFKTIGRHGPVVEVIYMNYPPPLLLHQYDYIGEGYVDRQRVKRKISRFSAKLLELPPYEKHLFIQEMIRNDEATVKHFLTNK